MITLLKASTNQLDLIKEANTCVNLIVLVSMIKLFVVKKLLEACTVFDQRNTELLHPFHSYNYYETPGRFRPTSI